MRIKRDQLRRKGASQKLTLYRRGFRPFGGVGFALGNLMGGETSVAFFEIGKRCLGTGGGRGRLRGEGKRGEA